MTIQFVYGGSKRLTLLQSFGAGSGNRTHDFGLEDQRVTISTTPALYMVLAEVIETPSDAYEATVIPLYYASNNIRHEVVSSANSNHTHLVTCEDLSISIGGSSRPRSDNLGIKSPLLCQLSYGSIIGSGGRFAPTYNWLTASDPYYLITPE